jgi:hypothetical protein
LVALVGLMITSGGISGSAQGQGQAMPNLAEMSGMPLPVGDLPDGTIVVRLVRGDLSNRIANHPVELHGGPEVLTVRTDETGRAEFSGIAIGTRVHAIATVDASRLESQTFEVPAKGGIRLMLVAVDPEMAKQAAEDAKLAAGPAQPGMVVLGGDSRFVLEFDDDQLTVYGLFEIVNTAKTPVTIPEPLVFDLPPGARAATVLEGSTDQAVAAGTRVTVTGPFKPGRTPVQTAYRMPYSGGTVELTQRMPAALQQLSVIARKVGDMHLASPQISGHRDMAADGRTYIIANGGTVPAGNIVTFTLTGLPHRATWPRTTALALAVAILLAGAWAGSRRPPAADADRQQKLKARRDRLFGELTRLEEQRRLGQVEDRRYQSRRGELVADLERLYGEIDEAA